MLRVDVQYLVIMVQFMWIFKEGQSSSMPTTISKTVTTACQHLHTGVICLHCPSLPLASVAMFVRGTTPCLIRVSQGCCSPAVTASLRQLEQKDTGRSSWTKCWVFTAAPEEKQHTMDVLFKCFTARNTFTTSSEKMKRSGPIVNRSHWRPVLVI